MVRNKCPIRDFRTKLIISVFGILMVLLGFTLTDLVIKVGFDDVTRQVIAIVTLVAVALEFTALGLKPNNFIRTIQNFNNQQKITFGITLVILGYAIAGLFGWQGISSFTSGQLIVVGFLTILDTWSK